MEKDITEVKACPECGSDNITHDEKKHQVVCRACGMVYSPMAPKRQEQFDKAAGLKKD